MDPFVQQLHNLCAAHPTRAKWVFVRSHAVGHTIGDRLVLEGTNWGNVRFVTPLDIATRMGAPFLVERGIDPSEEGLGPALMMRLLIGLPDRHAYFRPLADQPQLAAALWSTIRELRLAGVTAADIAQAPFASHAKRDELVALVDAYESFLNAERRGDVATVFAEALKHADWCPIGAGDCWTEQPDILWPPLARRLIDAMPGERIVPAAIELPGLSAPRRLHDARVTRQPPPPDAPLAFLTRPESFGGRSVRLPPSDRRVRLQPDLPGLAAPAGPPEGGRYDLQLFHAGGAEAEIEEVFRRILDSKVPLDQCEIVCASPQYSSLVWEKAIRYDWPVTLAQGIPAGLTRPGRALVALTEWIDDDFSAGRLRRMLQSGDIASDLGGGRKGVPALTISAGRAANLIVKAQAAWGRHTYRLALGRLAKSSRAAAERDDLGADVRDGLRERAKQSDELAAWIDVLLAAIPDPAADGTVGTVGVGLDQVVQAARLFVERYTARASALDAFAAGGLVDAIGDLRALGNFRCPLAQALRFIRERVESVTVGIDRARPGHLHVSALTGAAVAGRPHTFVIGLEEGRVFPAAFEDPILLDGERAGISPSLMRSHDRTDEAVYAALVRLAAVGTADTLSYSCRDLREYRDTYASWLLLQTYRVVSGKPGAAYRELHDHLGTPKSCLPEPASTALSESRWWLRRVSMAGASSRPAVFARYPSLEAGEQAAAARASDAFTEFDGYVPAAGSVLDPYNPGVVVSPTQLEKAAGCPFRHFLERGLGVSAIESGERDRDVWLDPLLRGSLLHDLYAQLLRRCRKAGRRVTLAEDAVWLRDQGGDVLRTLAIEMPPPSEEVRERETRLFLDDLAIFVDAEAALDPTRTPIGFEVGFGRAGASSDEPLAQSDPILIEIGGVKIRVAGQIDRIDQVGPSAFEIVDYKTGGYWPNSWKGTFAGGTRLQHALYGLAALELLKRTFKKPAIRAAEYYFSSAKGQQERKRIDTQPTASVAAVLADLRQVIASGLFVHAADEESCRFCDYGHACGGNAAANAAAKSEAPALAPFRKLGSHA